MSINRGTHLIKIENAWFCLENTVLSNALKYGLQSAGSIYDGEYHIAKLGREGSTEELGAAYEAYKAGLLPKLERLKGLTLNDAVFGNANMIHIVTCSMGAVDSIEDLYVLQKKQFGPPTDPKVIAAHEAAKNAREALEKAMTDNAAAMAARANVGYATGFVIATKADDAQQTHEL